MDLVTEQHQETEQDRLRIIIVDDSEAVRRSLSLLLRSSGYVVESFPSGLDALSDPSFSRADCLLIDYKMPGMDGLRLLNTLRREGIDTPAILISGVVTTGLAERALDAGFTTFMRKPMTRDDLKTAIKDALV